MKPRYSVLVFLSFVATFEAMSAEKLTHVDVFTSGQEGYANYRIPAIETTPGGSLIAFAEGRKHNGADPGFSNNDVDLVYKRSTDGGKTWLKLRVLDDPGERWSACNPATVVDRSDGRVWVFYCRSRPGRNSSTSRPGTDDCQAWARYSEDNGQKWSKPMDLTKVARDYERWGSSYFGPGGAIQNRSGRLIVPVYETTGRRDAKGKMTGGPSNAFVIYSDNHGRTWRRGALLPDGNWANENQLVELADGRIMMTARQLNGPDRWQAISSDRGQTWSVPQPGQSLTRVSCAIERYTLKSAGADRNRILWTGPKGPDRSKLVVRTSYDEGESFTNERMISGELASYSDLTIMKDQTVGVLWERAGCRHVTFTRFDREFLEPPDNSTGD